MSAKCIHEFSVSNVGDVFGNLRYSGGFDGGVTVSVNKFWDENAKNPELWLVLKPSRECDDGFLSIRLTRAVADKIVDALNAACIAIANEDASLCVYEESFR